MLKKNKMKLNIIEGENSTILKIFQLFPCNSYFLIKKPKLKSKLKRPNLIKF